MAAIARNGHSFPPFLPSGCNPRRGRLYWGVVKRLRHGTLTPVYVGSNPTTPAKIINKRKREIVEIWKDIEGYEGLYRVSNCGRVKRIVGRGCLKEREIKWHKCHHDYFQVKLFKQGEQKHILVHRLVAQTFIPNPANLPQINHKDENKANNHIDNLEWCTCEHNINYGTQITRRSKTVSQYTKDGVLLAHFKSMHEAERITGVPNGSISSACSGRSKTAHGYIWRCE